MEFSDDLITKHRDGPGTPHFSGINPLDFFLPGYANDNFTKIIQENYLISNSHPETYWKMLIDMSQ